MAQKTIAQIRKEYQAAQIKTLPAFVCAYETDARDGVQKLVAQARKKIERIRQEKQRLYEMGAYEREYLSYGVVCGWMKRAEALWLALWWPGR